MSDDETSWPPTYAPVETVAGLLQRGRGLGAVRAGEDPAAVYACVARDWRWDSTDDRHGYLARVLRDQRLPLEPVLAQLGGDEEACEHATRVLVPLARGGSAPAREALRAYVREGEHWSDVLDSMVDEWPVEWWDDLADPVRARLCSEDEERLRWHGAPWARWRARFGVAAPPGPARRCASGTRTARRG